MADTLVIVESPAKAKTIGKYLGRGYTVYASKGHVRDLPEKGLGVDVESGTFQPDYQVKRGQWQTINQIKEAARTATTVLLATDPDREGEAIAWHILIAAGLGKGGQSVRRVEFHEITANAIKNAIAHPRQVDMNLVNAQQARRVLDRLMGYKISPLLWNKIQKGLSAGRVQSVALRIIVEREQDIENFVPREFWTVEADLAKQPFKGNQNEVFHAVLWDKTAKAESQNSSEQTEAKDSKKPVGKKKEFERGEDAQTVVENLKNGDWKVLSIVKEPLKRYPSAPFTTSTLQQEASRKLRSLAKDTMKIAQQLYEGVNIGPEGSVGLITYMRTDSTQVAREAQLAARDLITNLYGAEYLPPNPPFYAKKAANAQEAHEAIRPTAASREPDALRPYLSAPQYWLYRLIWQRFIASQMSPALFENTIADINAQPRTASLPPYLFRANGLRLLFPGFLKVYEKAESENENSAPGEKNLPPLAPNDPLDALKLGAEQHFTQPPSRFSEATLVKTLEELGVGRPSTYATILSTIQERGYVVKTADAPPAPNQPAVKTGRSNTGRAEQRFLPTALGRAVNKLLVERFPNIVDVKFTARMEHELDEVANGERTWIPLVADFYGPMMQQLALAEREVTKIVVPADGLAASKTSTGGSKYGYRSKSGYAGKPSTGSAKTTTYKPRATATKTKIVAESPLSYEPTFDFNAPSVKPTATRARRPKLVDTTTSQDTTAAPAPVKRASRAKTAPKVALPEPAANNGPSTNSSAVTCDKCGKPMVRRKGPYGEFWGCTGFPNCRNIRK